MKGSNTLLIDKLSMKNDGEKYTKNQYTKDRGLACYFKNKFRKIIF